MQDTTINTAALTADVSELVFITHMQRTWEM